MKTCMMCKHFNYGQSDYIWNGEDSVMYPLYECKLELQPAVIMEYEEEGDNEDEVSEFLAKAETCPSFEPPNQER